MQMKMGWVAAVALALLAAPVRSEEGSNPATRPSGKAVETSTVSALVQQVDLAKREVTLKKVDGTLFMISVGPEVVNLAALKKDDLVVAKLTQTLVWQVAAPGQGPRPLKENVSTDRAKPGERPVGVKKTTISGNVLVDAMDRKASTITVHEAGGPQKVLTVRDAKSFDLVKVGDMVDVTYQEAMAVAVDPAPKK
jgi:hypothetical protein